MSDWQPIETAPRDGTDFLAWASYATGPLHRTIARRSVHIRGDGHARWYGPHGEIDIYLWQPLPEPPEVSDE